MTGKPFWLGGALLLSLVVAVEALGPLMLPYAPEQPNFAEILEPPSAAHWMGTDDLGRDVLARVLAGGRTSLSVAVGSVAGALLGGAPLGLASGHLGGWLERIAMRCVDVLLTVPAILLALAITAVLGPSAAHAALAIGLVNLPVFARLAYAQARALRGRDYVAAARGFGCSEAAILWRCIAPNAVAPMLVQSTVLLASAMLTESYLSFLGLGAQPPTPSWGGMVHDGIGFLDRAEWLPWFPGLALFATVLGVNLLGDGLRDRLDPMTEPTP
jgi:peptide/nickel transport system permease protein